jgi:uncharacterized protein DUF6165
MKHTKKMYLITIITVSALSFKTSCNRINAAISYGELVDKITILSIKLERITDQEKLKNIAVELNSLLATFDEYIGDRNDVEELKILLKKVNEILWNIEDDIRVKERNKEFDDEFIALARGVYSTNDKRMALKKRIDIVCGSHITEEKSYESYT